MAIVKGALHNMYKQPEMESGRPDAERYTLEKETIKLAQEMDNTSVVDKDKYLYNLGHHHTPAQENDPAKAALEKYASDFGIKNPSKDANEAKIELAIKKSEDREMLANKVVESAPNINPRETHKLDAKAEAVHGRTDVSLTAKGVGNTIIADVSKDAGIARNFLDTTTIRGQSPEAAKQYDAGEKGKTQPSPVAVKMSMMDKIREKAREGMETVKDTLGISR
jgi:hypothetical protein